MGARTQGERSHLAPRRPIVRRHGLTFVGDAPGATRGVRCGPVDVEVSDGGERPVPAALPDGQVVARLEQQGRLRFVVARVGADWCVRVPDHAEFWIADDLDEVAIYRHPGTTDEVVDLLFAGSLTAALLELRGDLVLHASAVTLGGRTVAVSARSGGGKSTLAGLLCAAGASLLTDDLLRVTWGPNGAPVVWPGTDELRLRAGATHLADLLVDAPTRVTADARTAVAVPVDASARSELNAVTLPDLRPDRSGAIVTERLSAPDSLLALASRPRLHGWQHPDILRRQFDHLAELVQRIPVVRLSVPWQQRFEPSFADTLARACRQEPWPDEAGGTRTYPL